MPEEKQHPTYTIVRSFASNLQHDSEGGTRFEKSEFFSSHAYTFFREPEEKQIEDVANLLYKRAKEDVEADIEMRRAEIRISRKNKFKSTKALDDQPLDSANSALDSEAKPPL